MKEARHTLLCADVPDRRVDCGRPRPSRGSRGGLSDRVGPIPDRSCPTCDSNGQRAYPTLYFTGRQKKGISQKQIVTK